VKLAGALLAIALSVASWIELPGGSWSATNELPAIHARLEPFVQAEARARGEKLPEWSRYTFQYWGQAEGARRFVFINAFCIPPPKYVKEHLVAVMDGGPCFFQVKYDPARKLFYDLSFNGVG
jgi:hypothetical protein